MKPLSTELILIRVTGEDRPGLTASVTEILAKYDATILDIGQADIHNTLSLGILCKTEEQHSGFILRQGVYGNQFIENEKTIIMAQMAEDPKMASKPEQVRAKIAEGKVGKYYSENCLLEQTFVRSDLFEGTVAKYVADAAKKLGGTIEVVECIRYERGEGVEKKADDFAAEVAAMAKGN